MEITALNTSKLTASEAWQYRDEIVETGREPTQEWTDCYDWSPDDLDSDDYMD